MSKHKKNGDKQVAKLALVTAVVALITQLLNIVEKLIEWLTQS